MRSIFSFLVTLIGANLLFAGAACAQVCTGSLGAPVVNETFGAGATYGLGPQLPASITSLRYVADLCGGNDGEYTILSQMGTTCKGGTWQSIPHDHTGDTNGYMMIINADINPSVFYTERVSGNKLCANTTYEFAAYIMNILRPLPRTQGFSKPNITFNIEKADGTVIKTYNTGDILESDYGTWVKYGTFFTTPADGSDIVVKMINNGRGGDGNDLALDDITFSPCGPLIQTGFGTILNTAPKSTCANDNLNYTLVAAQTGYPNPTYQWQQNRNDGSGWSDIQGQTTTTYNVVLPNAAAGEYQYRIGILDGANTSEVCRIYSDPLTINVYPPPGVVVAASTSVCVGLPLRLSSTGATTYQWSGPNGFASPEDSPKVTDNADASVAGVYTLVAIKNGCPTFTTTTVSVFDAPSVSPMADVTICEGRSAQLSAQAANVTHYKWTPATGLDHDDIANPIASPTQTTLYTVEVYNDGCPTVMPAANVKVTVLKKPVANAGEAIKLFEGQSAKLNGTAKGDNVYSYWTPAFYLDNALILNPTTRATQDIRYTLHVASESGCGEDTSSVFVRVYKKLVIPNTFSPNNDGINDYWNITNMATYPNATVTVYNRYGQQVFQSTGYGKPWAGTFNGATLPAGTFYYVIDLKEDKLAHLAGWVLIVK